MNCVVQELAMAHKSKQNGNDIARKWMYTAKTA